MVTSRVSWKKTFFEIRFASARRSCLSVGGVNWIFWVRFSYAARAFYDLDRQPATHASKKMPFYAFRWVKLACFGTNTCPIDYSRDFALFLFKRIPVVCSSSLILVHLAHFWPCDYQNNAPFSPEHSAVLLCVSLHFPAVIRYWR